MNKKAGILFCWISLPWRENKHLYMGSFFFCCCIFHFECLKNEKVTFRNEFFVLFCGTTQWAPHCIVGANSTLSTSRRGKSNVKSIWPPICAACNIKGLFTRGKSVVGDSCCRLSVWVKHISLVFLRKLVEILLENKFYLWFI